MAGPFGLNTGRRESAGRHPTASSAQAAVTVDAAYSDFFRQEFLYRGRLRGHSGIR